MPKKTQIDIQHELTARKRTILFAIVKEYCDTTQTLSSMELKEKYGFTFSPATIRNEMVQLRDEGYLFQPFTNSSSKPTEKAFKLFINQLITGLQVTSSQQASLRKQIEEMERKQASLSKEISRLLALTSGGVGFAVTNQSESIAGMGNLLQGNQGEHTQVSEILNFLDNLDTHKQLLLTSQTLTSDTLLALTPTDAQTIHTLIGGENAVIPLGKGYAMVATEVYLENNEKSVVGLITPIHVLARKKNLELMEAISKIFSKKNSPKSDHSKS
jgi:transcriptional regulator of heat shock response